MESSTMHVTAQVIPAKAGIQLNIAFMVSLSNHSLKNMNEPFDKLRVSVLY
jgi:hypothetical protein